MKQTFECVKQSETKPLWKFLGHFEGRLEGIATQVGAFLKPDIIEHPNLLHEGISNSFS